LRIPHVIGSAEDPRKIVCDALVLGAFGEPAGPRLATEGIDADLRPVVAEALEEEGFKGKVGEVVIVPTLGRAATKSWAIAGLGSAASSSSVEVRRAAACAARHLYHRSEIVSALHQSVDGSAAAALEGLILGTYRFGPYKSDHRASMIDRIIAAGATDREIHRAVSFAESTMLARDLVNEPASILTPTALAERAREIGDAAGLECSSLDEHELAAAGFGGILGVGKGSQQPPRLIRLHYQPPTATGKVAVVGKGVTYDSGGLSIKQAQSMETMKTDMSGGAAVIAALAALPKLDVPVEVLGIVPAVENLPSGSAIKPGDVITHYGGRTTEVLNTDAEGRLILADALAYAAEQRPEAIVDVATLTGAISIALGRKVAGLFATDEGLQQEILDAAAAAGERFWPMPLVSEYASELESDIADSKNVATRYGSSIFAALFMRAFVPDGIPWAHLDIAGTARADSSYDDVTKGGTGAATRTLIHWLEGRAR
jgi:leucyl aminopeptidase